MPEDDRRSGPQKLTVISAISGIFLINRKINHSLHFEHLTSSSDQSPAPD